MRKWRVDEWFNCLHSDVSSDVPDVLLFTSDIRMRDVLLESRQSQARSTALRGDGEHGGRGNVPGLLHLIIIASWHGVNTAFHEVFISERSCLLKPSQLFFFSFLFLHSVWSHAGFMSSRSCLLYCQWVRKIYFLSVFLSLSMFVLIVHIISFFISWLLTCKFLPRLSFLYLFCLFLSYLLFFFFGLFFLFMFFLYCFLVHSLFFCFCYFYLFHFFSLRLYVSQSLLFLFLFRFGFLSFVVYYIWPYFFFLILFFIYFFLSYFFFLSWFFFSLIYLLLFFLKVLLCIFLH